MAIKISGTTVIDDSRNIVNLATPLTVDQGGTGVSTSTGTGNAVLGTRPVLIEPSIVDSDANEIVLFTATSSAVNEFTLSNAATGYSPTLSATGTDSDVGIEITPKGTGEAHVTTSFLTGAYSDKVNNLGATGANQDIAFTDGGVVTATLTGNCVFNLSAPNSIGNRGSSFTLVLTNDATASRTVSWTGGTFKFPGGAGSLSRSTGANDIDIWVFFTPDGGTTYYGNIVMADLTT